MKGLAEAVRADLEEACASLLDLGIEQAVASAAASPLGTTPAGPLGHALRTAELLRRTVPRALASIELVPSAVREEVVYRRYAKAARPSLAARDYLASGARASGGGPKLVPVVWRAREPRLEPSIELMGWLVAGLDGLVTKLEDQRRPLEGQVTEARAFRRGSHFGGADLVTLERRREEVLGAIDAVRALRERVASLGDRRIAPNPRPPHPFPRVPDWMRIRRAFAELSDPRSALPSIAAHLVSSTGGVDLPFLYQRWCGWKLVEELRALGYRTTADPVAALLLSGSIELRASDAAGGLVDLDLLVEPRLVPGKEAIAGLRSSRLEITPDLVLVARHTDGARVFVLDPTLTREKTAIASHKGKYLDAIECGHGRVAGVRVVRRAERAWAAAPLDDGVNYVHSGDWRGARGVVPMNPLDWNGAPLRAWLEDLIESRKGWVLPLGVGSS